MTRKKPVIGITMGDPVGIGPEIIAHAIGSHALETYCTPVVLGDESVMGRAVALTGRSIPVISVKQPALALQYPNALCLFSCSRLDQREVLPGRPTAGTGRAMIRYIDTAVEMALSDKIDAMVTAPITKSAMKLAGSNFHGHTEMIAHATGTRRFAMMMAGSHLKVVLATIHIPLSDVPGALSIDGLLETITMTAEALIKRFGIPAPKIAVAGLNPHAGEGSLFGTEEENIIQPAVKIAREKGGNVTGPLPPDTVFFHAAEGRYHAVVCMYHDQGLIPFKMRHFHDGVNTTLGLPIIRTSPDHGTAYDIAWQGKADCRSLVEAVKLAALQCEADMTGSGL